MKANTSAVAVKSLSPLKKDGTQTEEVCQYHYKRASLREGMSVTVCMRMPACMQNISVQFQIAHDGQRFMVVVKWKTVLPDVKQPG